MKVYVRPLLARGFQRYSARARSELVSRRPAALMAADRPRKQLTLLLLHQGDNLLLGMKKRGFGEGKFNGFGGKIGPNETILAAAQRELEEEANVRALDPSLRGHIIFEFEGHDELLEVYVFRATRYEGEVRESEEMAPQWFSAVESAREAGQREGAGAATDTVSASASSSEAASSTVDNTSNISGSRYPPIPYARMWLDDEHWLPLLLRGRSFDAYFLFQGHSRIVKHEVEVLEDGEDLAKRYDPLAKPVTREQGPITA